MGASSFQMQLPPGLIGHGEKMFRADVTRVVSATCPPTGPNTQAAFSQKAWGRTNLGRLYDWVEVERLQALVAPSSHAAMRPRQGRSEKSGVMRQLICELHTWPALHWSTDGTVEAARAYTNAARDADPSPSRQTPTSPALCDGATTVSIAAPASNAAPNSSPAENFGGGFSLNDESVEDSVTAILSEMVVARLAQDAVYSVSRYYMPRAARVSALVGHPGPADLERLDFF
jgi:hypothetical protein